MSTTAYANPYIACRTCWKPVASVSISNTGPLVNDPCGHNGGVYNLCHSWSPVDGCRCAREHYTDEEIEELRAAAAEEEARFARVRRLQIRRYSPSTYYRIRYESSHPLVSITVHYDPETQVADFIEHEIRVAVEELIHDLHQRQGD